MKKSMKLATYLSMALGIQLAFANSKTFTFKYDQDSAIKDITYTFNGESETEKKFNIDSIDNNTSKKKVTISVNFDSNNSQSIANDFNNLVGGIGTYKDYNSIGNSWKTNNKSTYYPQKLLFWFQGTLTITANDGNVYELVNFGLGNNGNGDWWANSQDGMESLSSDGTNIVGLTVSDTTRSQTFCFSKTGSANVIKVHTGECS